MFVKTSQKTHVWHKVLPNSKHRQYFNTIVAVRYILLSNLRIGTIRRKQALYRTYLLLYRQF